MNDNAKEKIIFALSLLATLFAIQPFVANSRDFGFFLCSIKISLFNLYCVVAFCLGLATYFFALTFATNRLILFFNKLGNFLYALSLLIPPLFFLLWLSSFCFIFVGKILNNPFFAPIANSAISVITGVFVTLLSSYVSKRLSRKDREIQKKILSQTEIDHIQRSHQMLDSGHYDLSILETYRAIESAVRGAIVSKKLDLPFRKQNEIFDFAKAKGIIPNDVFEEINKIRKLRNDAVHSLNPTNKDDAYIAFNLSKRILRILDQMDWESCSD